MAEISGINMFCTLLYMMKITHGITFGQVDVEFLKFDSWYHPGT